MQSSYDLDDCDVRFFFFHFEVRVASGDSRVVIFARIRIDNLPVHLGYNGTCNGSRVSLQLLKNHKDVNGHEESVSWLQGTCIFRSFKTFLDSHTNFPRDTSENTMQSWSTSAYFARSMIENMRDKQRCRQTISKGEVNFRFITVARP